MKIPSSKPNQKLDALLAKAKTRGPLTPREVWQQRVSFVYGQMMDCAPDVTREEIEAEAVRIYGPCP